MAAAAHCSDRQRRRPRAQGWVLLWRLLRPAQADGHKLVSLCPLALHGRFRPACSSLRLALTPPPPPPNSLVETVMSYQMTRFVIDAQKAVLQRASPEARTEDFEFEEGEVYAIDMIVSTGEGKPK